MVKRKIKTGLACPYCGNELEHDYTEVVCSNKNCKYDMVLIEYFYSKCGFENISHEPTASGKAGA